MSLSDDIQQFMSLREPQSEALRLRLTAMVAEDVAAFDSLMAAYKLPKLSDADKARRAPCPPANAGPQCHAPRRLRRSLVGVGYGAIHASPVQIQQYIHITDIAIYLSPVQMQQYISHLYIYSNIYLTCTDVAIYTYHLYRCSNTYLTCTDAAIYISPVQI